MEKIQLKYAGYANALPPQPIKMGPWGGEPQKMKDGSDPQPWHCLPFVEGSTYGVELIYQHQTECHVVGANGTIHFEFDWPKEPGGVLTGMEFGAFSPVAAAKYYLFNTRLDVQCPPAYTLRTEPHPRYFTDETGTVPLALIGHMQNDWYARLLFVVFRAPRQGERHIFRKGEPFAQLIFVPQRVEYEITRMTPEEEAQRRQRERAVGSFRKEIADHHWTTADGGKQDNHYKVLVRAFARDGMAGIEKTIQEAVGSYEKSIAQCQTTTELLTLGDSLMEEREIERAADIYARVLRLDPHNAEALSQLGRCYTAGRQVGQGIEMMKQAIRMDPRVPRFHRNLGDAMRRIGWVPEAEEAYRAGVELAPEDVYLLSALSLMVAQQGKVAEAVEKYRKAAALGLSLVKTHVDIGLALVHFKAFAEARACFENALAVDPKARAAKQALEELARQEERMRDEG